MTTLISRTLVNCEAWGKRSHIEHVIDKGNFNRITLLTRRHEMIYTLLDHLEDFTHSLE